MANNNPGRNQQNDNSEDSRKPPSGQQPQAGQRNSANAATENRGSSGTAGRDVDSSSARQGDKQYDRQSQKAGGSSDQSAQNSAPGRSEVDTDTDLAANKYKWDNNSTKGGSGQAGRDSQARGAAKNSADDIDATNTADETEIEGGRSSGPSPSANRKGQSNSQSDPSKKGGGDCGCG